MKNRGRKIEDGGWRVRSALKCGCPLPLSSGSRRSTIPRSARGLAQSKTLRQFLAGFAFAMLPLSSTFGQSYSIDWFTMDGGGGTSTGSVYSVSGTIGQPDAGTTMSGGNYLLTGGFWSLLGVLQTEGAPLLSITLTITNTALISWLSPSTGWNLQQNTNLSTARWVVPSESFTDNGMIKFIMVNPPAGNRFYRLFKP